MSRILCGRCGTVHSDRITCRPATPEVDDAILRSRIAELEAHNALLVAVAEAARDEYNNSSLLTRQKVRHTLDAARKGGATR